MAPTTYGYKNPLFYEYEVLTNLEELNIRASEKAKDDKKNFKALINGVTSSSEKIVSTISDEAEKSRIQAKINAEKIEAGISETNYRLLNISRGINTLESQVKQSGKEIVNQLEITNKELFSIDTNLLIINSSLTDIGNILNEMLSKISNPNEVAALEIINQIRINLAIGKQDEALRLSRKALDLSSTSIPVLAYHLMSLSLFNDKFLINESKEKFNDFVKLIKFKLYDAKSDTKAVREEIYYFVYPVLFSLSRSLGTKILNETQLLYSFICNDETATVMLLTKPLEDKSTEEMTLYPSPLRELHWTVILKEEIIANRDYEMLFLYIPKVAQNNILIKTELLMLANKTLFESGVLYDTLLKTLHEDTTSESELESLKIFVSMQPQVNFKLDDKTNFLITRFILKYNIEINSDLQKILDKTSSKLKTKINQYRDKWEYSNKTIRKYENKNFPKVQRIAQELLKKNNNSKIKTLIKDIEHLEKKIVGIKNEKHIYDYDKTDQLKNKISIIFNVVIFGLMIFIEYHLFAGPGFWKGLLATPFIVIPAILLMLLGTPIIRVITNLVAIILRFLNGRDVNGITSSIHKTNEMIKTKKKQINDIKNENLDDFDKVVMSAYSISAYGEVLMSKLMIDYKQIVKNFFVDSFHNKNITREVEALIDGNFPNKFKLSDDFYLKLFSLLGKFKETEPDIVTIQDKLLFKKEITLTEIENSDRFLGMYDN